jgi:3-keto-5-aminohexanoate cleavage enzyme
MSDDFILMCAPNGARKMKDDHPEVPIGADDLADCAESIVDAGASLIHVHVRDPRGRHSLDTDEYRRVSGAIKDRVGEKLVVQVTTEACGIYSRYEQMAMVRDLKPEAISVAVREICPDAAAEAEAAKFYRWLSRENVMAQHILYSPEEVQRFERLRARDVICESKPFVLFVLGRYASDLTGDVSELPRFIEAASAETIWAVCCFGATEHEAVTMAVGSGGHARIGFENNLTMPDGSIAKNNAALVANAAGIGLEARRKIASADDLRQLLS